MGKMIDYNLIKMLIVGLLFGSLFIVKKSWKTSVGWFLIGYLIYLGATL